MTQEHTPLPWRRITNRPEYVFGGGYAVAVCQPDYRSLPSEGEADQQSANAAFIVRCVNSHEALVDLALNVVMHFSDARHAGSVETTLCSKARAALKLARGES